MSTPTEEIEVDIAAADAKAAEEAARKPKPTPDTDPDALTVETADPPATAPAKTAPTVDEGLEKIKRDLAAAEARAEAAEARANEAAQGEAKARETAQTSQLDLVKSAIERVTQANDALESQYADALSAGDNKAAAKVMREMTSNSAKLTQLEAGKVALEKAPKPTPRPPSDPVEAFCAQLSAPSAAWVRSHPEFVRDPQKNQQMLAAHQLAIARGHTADTPEYFGSIEKTLDVTAPTKQVDPEHDTDPMADAARPVNGAGRTPAPASAPVSRGGNGNGSRPNVVRLTPDQREAAYANFPNMSPQEAEREYARNLVALRKEGRLQ